VGCVLKFIVMAAAVGGEPRRLAVSRLCVRNEVELIVALLDRTTDCLSRWLVRSMIWFMICGAGGARDARWREKETIRRRIQLQASQGSWLSVKIFLHCINTRKLLARTQRSQIRTDQGYGKCFHPATGRKDRDGCRRYESLHPHRRMHGIAVNSHECVPCTYPRPSTETQDRVQCEMDGTSMRLCSDSDSGCARTQLGIKSVHTVLASSQPLHPPIHVTVTCRIVSSLLVYFRKLADKSVYIILARVLGKSSRSEMHLCSKKINHTRRPIFVTKLK